MLLGGRGGLLEARCLVLLGRGDEAAVRGLLRRLAAVVGDVRERHHQLVAVSVRLPPAARHEGVEAPQDVVAGELELGRRPGLDVLLVPAYKIAAASEARWPRGGRGARWQASISATPGRALANTAAAVSGAWVVPLVEIVEGPAHHDAEVVSVLAPGAAEERLHLRLSEVHDVVVVAPQQLDVRVPERVLVCGPSKLMQSAHLHEVHPVPLLRAIPPFAQPNRPPTAHTAQSISLPSMLRTGRQGTPCRESARARCAG